MLNFAILDFVGHRVQQNQTRGFKGAEKKVSFYQKLTFFSAPLKPLVQMKPFDTASFVGQYLVKKNSR